MALAAATRRSEFSPPDAATGIPSAALPPIVTRPEIDPVPFVFASGAWAFAANAVNRIAGAAIKAWQSNRVRLFMGCLLFRFEVQPFCGRYDRTVIAPAQAEFVPICSL